MSVVATVAEITSRALTRATDPRWRLIVFSALLVGVACLGLEPSNPAVAGSASNTLALAAYQQARDKVGRDADAHASLALWCESQGLSSERQKHLTIAVLTDPAHARARGLLGLVAFRGRWQLPEEIRQELQADETLSASLAEYRARRARMRNSADAHLKIAIWCEEHGLKPEATAHLTVATQRDPGLEAAWKKLGYRKHGSRWITDWQLADEKAQSEARTKAYKYWTTLLARLRTGLEYESSWAGAARTLQGISDPTAVPSVWAIFAGGSSSHQALAVQLFGQIDSPDSTQALAVLAVASESGEVRGKSVETLRRRDSSEIAPFLLGLLSNQERRRAPILYHYLLQPVGWNAIGSIGYLFVQGPFYDVFRTYTVDESVSGLGMGVASMIATSMDRGYVNRIMTQRQRQVSDLFAAVGRILSDCEGVIPAPEIDDKTIDQLTTRIIDVLSQIHGRYLGKDVEVWRKWWADEQGYVYEPAAPHPRLDLTLSDDKPTFFSTNVHLSCFAAGTPVHTLAGLRPIESVQIGDQVLTQDPRTAELSYQPVLAAVQNKPDKIVEINLGGEVIRATAIHRFWKAGQGWVPARDLKSGDSLRALGGIAEVKAVRRGQVQPVFNLKVMRAQSFFVGERGMLVHDNSAVEPVSQPFDLVPEIAGDH
jgi:Pretoxin HINT domain